jgi:NAD(P)-dependent dehydrogenase (short-subunit alcohol dehydrogenase family)
VAWTTDDIADQSGRTFLVTGANSGIGLVAAQVLAGRGAHVILGCRDPLKGHAAAEQIDGNTEVLRVDLASLASVRAAAEALDGRPIDVLVNNAGIMATPQEVSVDGHELQFATNVLGPFALTSLLLGRVSDRVVWVSSMMHRMGRLDLADPSFRHHRYNPWRAYGASKLADLMLAYELQRRLTLAGSIVRSYAAHPGYAHTGLQRHTAVLRLPLVHQLEGLLKVAQSAADGALPIVYAATAPDLAPGSYVGPSGFGELAGPPRIVGSSAASHDRDTQRTLWALCEGLTGTSPGLPG